jgi:hypothetical protein
MERDGKRLVPDIFLSGLTEFFDLLVTSILLAIAIDIFAGNIAAFIGLTELEALILGCLVGFVAVAIFVWRLFSQREHTRSLNGFLIHYIVEREKFGKGGRTWQERGKGDLEVNEIVDVSRYHYSSYAQKLLKAGRGTVAIDEDWNKWAYDEVKTKELLKEITIAYVLYELSNHRRNHFTDKDSNKGILKEYKPRELGNIGNIAGVSNFLSPFLRQEHCTREAGTTDVLDLPDIRCSANDKYGKESADFEIVTKKMRVQVSVNLGLHTTGLPPNFEYLYLGIKEQPNASMRTYQVRIDFSISFRRRVFFSPPDGWKYYRWIDSFLDELNQKFSKDAFFERIGWETALTAIEGVVNHAKMERIRIRSVKEDRRNYLETERLTKWLLQFHEYHGGSGLQKLKLGENTTSLSGIRGAIGRFVEDFILPPTDKRQESSNLEIPFLSQPDWDAPDELLDELKIHESRDSILFDNSKGELSTEYRIDYDLIDERELIGQRIWDAPTMYLDNITGSAQDGGIKIAVKACRYFESATRMIELENETINGVKFGKYDGCPLRKEFFLKVSGIKHNLYRPMTLGCMVVFALKAKSGYDIIYQTRSTENATANSVVAIAPTFGLSPFLGKPPKNKGLLFYNFLKEYLEEFFNQRELIQPFDLRTPYDRYYESLYSRPEVRPLLSDHFNLYYLGFGFNLINGYPNIGLLAKLDSRDDSDFIKKHVDPNWEIAKHAEIHSHGLLPLGWVNSKKLNELEKLFLQIEPAGGFFLSSALKYLA